MKKKLVGKQKMKQRKMKQRKKNNVINFPKDKRDFVLLDSAKNVSDAEMKEFKKLSDAGELVTINTEVTSLQIPKYIVENAKDKINKMEEFERSDWKSYCAFRVKQCVAYIKGEYEQTPELMETELEDVIHNTVPFEVALEAFTQLEKSTLH